MFNNVLLHVDNFYVGLVQQIYLCANRSTLVDQVNDKCANFQAANKQKLTLYTP